MNREQKEFLVQNLKENFSTNNAAFLVKYKGLTVVNMQNLRKQLRSCGGKLKVAKGRLIKLAVEQIPGVQDLDPFLKDQIAVVFVNNEPSAVAKVLYNFSKEVEALDIVAGYAESRICPKELVVTLAALPPRNILLAQLCGLLQAPIANLARALDAAAKKETAPTSASEQSAQVERTVEQSAEQEKSGE